MATALKRIDLFLDEGLINRLNQEAAQRQVSPSEVVQTLLSRDFGLGEQPCPTVRFLPR